jgi:hypothetical protein
MLEVLKAEGATGLDILVFSAEPGGRRPVNFYFSAHPVDKMFIGMSQSERLTRIMNENRNYVSRSKVRDSSELTAIRQAKASALKIPQLVQGTALKVDAYGVTTSYSTMIVTKGKGTNMEYLNVLQAAQGCAICADNVGPDVLPGIYVSTFTTYDRSVPPFAQKTLSNAYTPSCKVAEPVRYFPPFLERGDTNNYTEQGVHDPANKGTTVSYQHLPLPSG